MPSPVATLTLSVSVLIRKSEWIPSDNAPVKCDTPPAEAVLLDAEVGVSNVSECSSADAEEKLVSDRSDPKSVVAIVIVGRDSRIGAGGLRVPVPVLQLGPWALLVAASGSRGPGSSSANDSARPRPPFGDGEKVWFKVDSESKALRSAIGLDGGCDGLEGILALVLTPSREFGVPF